MNNYPVNPSPINIRRPWNPVAIKKFDPYAGSAIVYLYAWSAIK